MEVSIIPIVLLITYFSSHIPRVHSEFTLTVWHNGSYSVNVNNKRWLIGASTDFQASGQHHSTSDGTLKMASEPMFVDGLDTFGSWTGVNYTWGLGETAKVDTVVKKYKAYNVAIFSQNFREGLTGTSVGNQNGVISSFPSFLVGRSDTPLGVMAYGGLFIGWFATKHGKWNAAFKPTDGLESGPLLLFDDKGNVIIVSPFSQFMAASFAHDKKNNALRWGIMGDVDSVPDNFEYSTIVYYCDQGLNKAMSEWGSLLRMWYSRTTAARQVDLSINYLGYYTDNGAYYYHDTEPGMNYEKTVLSVKNYAETTKIPYRYIQLDDWWYPIKGPGYGATITWTAMPSVFPHGLQYIYNQTQWPVVAHNRYWSNITTYAKQNGGKFNFLMDGKMSLPDDQSFWDYLMGTAKKWGLIVYEQDWLNYHVENFGKLHSDVSLGRRWLHQMGEAATRFGLQLQYCMALPRHLLATLEVPAVSQIRASNDYHFGYEQWKIGITSMFADAMGIAPFKDNLWTTTIQPGNVYNKTEPNTLLEVTVALLSTGPVGVGDRLGYTNPDLLNRLVNADGLLLKPSKPAMAVDDQILQYAFDVGGPHGEVWTTCSKISGFFFGLIFSPELSDVYYVGPKEAGFPDENGWIFPMLYDSLKDVPKPFGKSNPLALKGCTNHNFCLYYTTPVFTWRNKPLIMLGELAKLVPMSPQRVTSIEYGSDDITVTLQGKPGEQVTFHICYNNENLQYDVNISESGSTTLSLTRYL